MKTLQFLAIALFAATISHAQPAFQPPPLRPPGSPADPAREAMNYVVRVEWKAPKEDAKFLQILTTEGSFDLNTIQKNSVKINNNEVPITLKFSGSLTALGADQARLRLFLGRTVPYVTGSVGSGPNMSSSYSQLSVGLDSTFIVKFGESEVIQSDENGDISVLVTRADK